MSEKPPVISRTETSMNPERGEKRNLLLELEATNLYVFHGSPIPDIEELEPRQSHTFLTKDKEVEDGAPGVAATRFVDAAIFHALIRNDTRSFGQDDEWKLHLRATKKARELVAPVGYVYVFRRTQFLPRHGDQRDMEWRSNVYTKPERVITVTKDDVPDTIEELGSDEFPES